MQRSIDGKMYIHGDSDGAATAVFKGAHVRDPGLELVRGLDSTHWKTCLREATPVPEYLTMFIIWPTTRVVLVPACICAESDMLG